MAPCVHSMSLRFAASGAGCGLLRHVSLQGNNLLMAPLMLPTTVPELVPGAWEVRPRAWSLGLEAWARGLWTGALGLWAQPGPESGIYSPGT